jgi:hypothetical protein
MVEMIFRVSKMGPTRVICIPMACEELQVGDHVTLTRIIRFEPKQIFPNKEATK